MARIIARRTALALPLLAVPASAQAWPSRALRIIVPFTPGGPTDVVARILGHGLSASLGQPVVIENRGGAGGNIGAALAARAAPDGYSLMVHSTGFVVNASLFRNPGYDPLRDFAPISEVGASPDLFLARAESTVRSLDDLLARARATPDGMHFTNPGTGSTPHLASERLAILRGVRFVQVAHPSAALAVQALLAGTTEIGATALASSHAQIQAGRLRALALTGPERWPELPDVPTMRELGYADFVTETFFSFAAPAGTPHPIIERLARDAAAVLAVPETRARMQAAGFILRPNGPEALAAREVPMWRELIARAGIQQE
jgi:tripartite-type tricarboxylate transporter receptor subunit TctC